MSTKASKELYAYGSNQPLQVAGMFTAEVSVGESVLRTVPTIVTAHTFCTSRDTRVSYGWCLLIQGYFCAV